MKNKILSLIAIFSLVFLPVTPAFAADGSWNVNAAGNWSDAGNWAGGTIADGTDSTATFPNIINADRAITLDTIRTIGNITASDTSNRYTISGVNMLTLDVSSGVSIIDVTTSPRTLTISVPVTVNDGLQKDGAGEVSMSGGVTLGGAQTWTNNSGGSLTVTNANLLDNAGYQLTVDGTGTTTFGTINNATPVLTGSGALVKNGTGRLNVGGVNAGFTGTVTINGGVLQAHNNAGVLGNGNVTINDGVLSFYWSVNYTRTLGTGNSQVQILGGESGFAGAGTTGPTVNLGATVVWGASGEGTATGYFNPDKFVLGDSGTSNAAVTTFSSGIDLNGATRTIVVPYGNSAGGNKSTISGIISNSSGTAGLIKEGDGQLTLSGNNSYNGGTTVSAGTLVMGNANALGSTSGQLTVNTGGTLNIANYNLTVGNLTGTGGTIQGSAAGTRTFTIGQGDGTGGNFQGVIADGTGTTALTKTGSGTITLSGANTYAGATAINAGVLNIQNASALGTVAAGTTVSSGAALQIQGGITTLAEALTLNGTGVSSDGALRNISGDNDYAGLVTLGSATRINSDTAGQTLTLSNVGTITGNTFGLTVGGVGNTTINSIIGTGTGTLAKDGAGTLTLGGANTYTGATSISAGVLNIQNASALGTVAAGTSVTSGAALQIQGGITTLAEALTLDGTGVSSDGALRNISGDNDYAGLVTLGSASRINSDAGTLTLSNVGTITGNTFGLTVGGAGNTTINSIIGTGTGTLTKDGNGTLTLGGTNTYTGTTTVTAGTLAVNGSIQTSSLTTVAAGATIAGGGTTGALTVSGALSPGSSPGTLSSVGAVSYEGGGSYTWEINNATGSAGTNWDLHNITGGLTINATSGSPFTINITSLKLADNTPGDISNFNKLSNYTWTIASATGGITGFDATDFTLDSSAFTNGVAGTFGISASGTNLQLTYTPTPPPNPIYWKGTTDTMWNEYTGGVTNWVDGSGVEAGAVPNSTSDVHFYYTGAGNLATTLGENFSISTLTMDAGTGVVSISGNTLTLGSSANAITLEGTAGALTINSNVVLGASQSWVNDSANTLTVGGTVTNGGNTLTVTGAGDTDITGAISGTGGLTKTGAGTLELTGANDYTGVTTDLAPEN